MEKEFGKLSSQQVIDFYNIFCKFVNGFIEDFENIENTPLAPDQYTPRWYKLYESSLNEVTASLISLLLMENEVLNAVTTEDPQQYMIDLLSSDYESPLDVDSVDPEKIAHLIAHMICLVMHGICVAAYRVDLNKLLDEGLNGHKDSFLKAVNIDPCVLNTETATKIIAKAVMEEDGFFFDNLSKAVKGSYPKGASVKYPLLNFFIYLIEDAAGENSIDKKELHKLFTEQISLYPDVTKLEDSFGSFGRQVRRMKHKVKDNKT